MHLNLGISQDFLTLFYWHLFSLFCNLSLVLPLFSPVSHSWAWHIFLLSPLFFLLVIKDLFSLLKYFLDPLPMRTAFLLNRNVWFCIANIIVLLILFWVGLEWRVGYLGFFAQFILKIHILGITAGAYLSESSSWEKKLQDSKIEGMSFWELPVRQNLSGGENVESEKGCLG